ncbi:MAG: HAD family hydrolase [Spirochaetia bacterium]|nr:HAD family hydrolase [Spirochaetia bacterium]
MILLPGLRDGHPQASGLLFDLDGTLLNTLTDLTTAINTALAGMGCPARVEDEVRTIVGGGMAEMARRSLPEDRRSEAEVEECRRRILDVYSHCFMEKTEPYPGVTNSINTLVKKGAKIAIVSNKPQDFTDRLVKAFFYEVPFVSVIGSNGAFPRKPDPAGASAAALAAKLDVHACAIIGDSDVDMFTASRAEMLPIGVLWGFRSKDELIRAGARVLLEDPAEIALLAG